MASGARYFKVESFPPALERQMVEEGKLVRNYGRLNRATMDDLASQRLAPIDKQQLFSRPRPWRLRRFLRDLAGSRYATFGEASSRDYTLRVLNGSIADVLGKGKPDNDQEELFSPFNSSDQWWGDFQMHSELLGTSLVNLLPDRPFSLYVFAKDALGDDVPIFYMELSIKNVVDRHVLVWEMDQVQTQTTVRARPHEAARASEYASVYQKLYFFINWDEQQPRRIMRAIVSDLPKGDKDNWDRWLAEQHEASAADAVVSIIILTAACVLAITSNEASVTLIAGIVVAGIASEEFLPPQAILFGGMARFFSNESLALRMYYRTNTSLSFKRVIITVLASIAEVSDILGTILDQFVSDFSLFGLRGSDVVLVVATGINVLALLETAYAGIYGGLSHSDFPSKPFYYPRAYVEKTGFFRQVVDDCRAVEEFASVYRPLLHWQGNVKDRFLGNEIDLAAPGSPPSFLCLFLCVGPASSRMAQATMVYGDALKLHLLPLAMVEMLLATLGSIMTVLLDLPVTLVLAVVLVARRTRILPRSAVRAMTGFALSLYGPAQLFLYGIDAYNASVAGMLGMETLLCRGRSTARLYRIPLVQRVRTGRSSNHSWKFADWLYDGAYYRQSDMVIVNPRLQKCGMVEPRKLFFNRHKLLWTTFGGLRYENACLACGDNTVSRRHSIVDMPNASFGSLGRAISQRDLDSDSEEDSYPVNTSDRDRPANFRGDVMDDGDYYRQASV